MESTGKNIQAGKRVDNSQVISTEWYLTARAIRVSTRESEREGNTRGRHDSKGSC